MDKKPTIKTYVISVSVGTGCYRHIKISGDKTLEYLHEVILWAFDFDDDHAHAFFMDNKAWNAQGYFADFIEDEDFHTCDYTLSQVLKDKQKFLYIFDFGDEWRFQCRVLRITDEVCENAEIIRKVGKSPEQYPDYDEEDYYEEDYE